MENPQVGMRFRLRQATEVLHRSLETRLDLEHGEIGCRDYVTVLAGFAGLYAPIERELGRLDWRDTGIDFAERKKHTLIESDLKDFGFDADAIAKLPQSSGVPRADTIPDALGMLYVLEGSTLGGQVILRRLAAKLGIGPAFGGRFFASYGPNVGRMWRSYVDVVERFGQTAEAADAIERTAIDAFRAFDDWFSDAAIRAGLVAMVEARRGYPDRRAGRVRADA